MLQKKPLAEQSAEAHCSFKVGTTSEYLAKLSHLIEESSHLTAELQKLVSKPDLASDLFFGALWWAEMSLFEPIPVKSISSKNDNSAPHYAPKKKSDARSGLETSFCSSAVRWLDSSIR